MDSKKDSLGCLEEDGAAVHMFSLLLTDCLTSRLGSKGALVAQVCHLGHEIVEVLLSLNLGEGFWLCWCRARRS